MSAHDLGERNVFSYWLKMGSSKELAKTRGPEETGRTATGDQPSIAQAMDLMAERRWPEAARLLRIILSKKPDPSVWMQYGHALKEAGFFSQAEAAYREAGAGLGESEDIYLQLGHLRKVTGHFALAKESYRIARSLGSDENSAVSDAAQNNLSLGGLTNTLIQKGNNSLTTLFFSCASKLGSVLDGSIDKEALGGANYSYSFAMRGFQRAANQLGIEWSFLAAPQYIPDVTAITDQPNAVHINFAPPKHARLLKGAYNILAFAWEFPALTLEWNIAHAFSDPTHMLDLFDEIWIPSRFGVEVVRKHTKRTVSFVPSPIISEQEELGSSHNLHRQKDRHVDFNRIDWIPLSIFPRFQPQFNLEARNRGRKIFEIIDLEAGSQHSNVYLTMFNPHDLRKQVRPLIDGFLEFQKTVSDAILLIKAVSDIDDNTNINGSIVGRQFMRDFVLVHPYASESIWITNCSLSERELEALYSMVNFYLCTSYCEGQNLPILEAMKRGVIPISPNHTAMADYINEKNSIILPSTTRPCAELMEVYRLWGYSTNVVEPEDVTRALLTASKLDERSRNMLSEHAIHTVSDRYNSQILTNALTKIWGGVGVG